MDNDELEQALTEMFHEIHPDMKVEFADGLGDNIEDQADLIKSIMTMTRRMSGRLGFFWRWYYRPEPWEAE